MKRCRPIGISCWLLVMAVAAPASLIGAPAHQEPESQRQDAKPEVKEQTTRDTLRVAYPFKFSSESAYLDWVNQRATTLIAAADVAPGAPRQTELLLAAANRLLASGTEHAASTRVLGILQDEMPAPEALDVLFQRVETILESAGKLIKLHEDANPKNDAQRRSDGAKNEGDKVEEKSGNDEGRGNNGNELAEKTRQVWRELSTRRDTIQAFGHALRTYLLDTGTDDDARSKRRAASKLSMLLESDSVPIAASARLWQALLRSKEQDPSRALSIVGPVTTPPRVGAQPYRFYGAILRAKLLSEHQSPTLALAMLMRVEEMVETWFSGQRNRGHALRTSAFTRVEILQAWAQTLAKKEDHQEEVAWCQAGILTLQEDWLTGEMPRLLRLSPAIPLLVAPSDLGVDDPKPDDKNEVSQ